MTEGHHGKDKEAGMVEVVLLQPFMWVGDGTRIEGNKGDVIRLPENMAKQIVKMGLAVWKADWERKEAAKRVLLRYFSIVKDFTLRDAVEEGENLGLSRQEVEEVIRNAVEMGKLCSLGRGRFEWID